jgi:hypothetical protein
VGTVLGWILFGAIVVGGAVGALLLARSIRRWKPTTGTSPDARAAEARLWQTRSMDQR